MRTWLLTGSLLLGACSPPGSIVRGVPARYAQGMDSATQGCVRNPACYTAPQGEEAILPWLSRAGEVVRATTVAMQLLEDAEVQRIEQTLAECAGHANFVVNERRLGGRSPTREQCREVVGKDRKGHDITRAMTLGQEKHQEALTCVQRALGERFAENLQLEPHYQKDAKTGRWQRLDPKRVAQWLSEGLFSNLLTALVPDVVLHAKGNPLKVQAVYDFKFPCPASNEPTWRDYPEGHPYYPNNQGEMYQQALGVEHPTFVTPQLGVVR